MNELNKLDFLFLFIFNNFLYLDVYKGIFVVYFNVSGVVCFCRCSLFCCVVCLEYLFTLGIIDFNIFTNKNIDSYFICILIHNFLFGFIQRPEPEERKKNTNTHSILIIIDSLGFV